MATTACWVVARSLMYLDDPYPSIHYTGIRRLLRRFRGFGNDIIIKSYQTFSGLYTGMYAIYGDNREFYKRTAEILLYHFHIADPIRFENKFRMTLDNMADRPRYDDYTSVAYWYQTLPSAPLMPLPTDADVYEIIEPDQRFAGKDRGIMLRKEVFELHRYASSRQSAAGSYQCRR